MKHWPSENFSHQTENAREKTLSPELQKALHNAISELKNNPETQKTVKEDFSNLFEMLAKNPETAELLDAKVVNKMHENLANIQQQHAKGEIYSHEAREQSQAVIHHTTAQRLQIFSLQNNLQTT